MKNSKITILVMLFTIASFSQIELISKDSLYVHPQNLGQYPNATLEYVGEVNDSYNKTFNFIFHLRTQNDELISKHNWSVSGTTEQGNLIKNHGLLSVIELPDTLQYTFTDYALDLKDFNDPTLKILEHPELSYDDILTWFVLGTKLEKVQLPNGAVGKSLIEWMLLNQMNLNGEPVGNQFQF